jgi:ubiquinone biosynthesis monooxygenase Coq7
MYLKNRCYSFSDRMCLNLDALVRAVFNNPVTTGRDYPSEGENETPLTQQQRKHSAGLVRVNHAGEVCAQALYHGQSLAARDKRLKEKMNQAAMEEGDHLAWCERRLLELGSHTSYLNLFWYIGSWGIGYMAGRVNDRWSLGFLAETENQVIEHLETHLSLLPSADKKTYHVLKKMQEDEAKHRDEAVESGAVPLPLPVRKLMSMMSRVMVKTAYWL